MSEASPSQELECLRRLAAQPGAASAGLLAPSQPGLLAVGADGAERPADAATSVLVQGMLAAAAALAQRFD